jgi:glycolate oxidase iron-sulfur subunit
VALFTGSVGDIAERDVLQEAIDLLRATGIQAAIPTTQGCCGALHQHGGMPEEARACARRNAMAFRDSQQVLPLASGCGAALRDLGIGSLEGVSPLAPKVQDLCTVLADALDRQAPVFAALPLRVGIHTACTQAHGFGAAGAVRRLLARVPELTLVDLAPETGCCGAAGTAFLTAPAQADALLAPKLAAATGLDVIVSANIGCTLHLQAGLRARGQNVTVRHPVSLLAQVLRQ